MRNAIERAGVSGTAQKKIDQTIQQEQIRVLEGEMTKDEIACWDGSHEACDRSATHYYFLASPTNEKKGVELFKEGCRLGNKKSCSSLKLLEEGKVKVFSVEVDD